MDPLSKRHSGHATFYQIMKIPAILAVRKYACIGPVRDFNSRLDGFAQTLQFLAVDSFGLFHQPLGQLPFFGMLHN